MVNKLLVTLVVLWEFCSPVLSAASQSALQLPCFTSFLAEPVYHLQGEPAPTPAQIEAWKYERRLLRREITPRKNISIEAYNAGYTTLNGLQISNLTTEVSVIRFRIEELNELIRNGTQANATEPETTTTQTASTTSTQAAATPATTSTGSTGVTSTVTSTANTAVNGATNLISGVSSALKKLSLFNAETSQAKHAARLSFEEIQILHGQQKAVYGWRFLSNKLKRILRERYPVPDRP